MPWQTPRPPPRNAAEHGLTSLSQPGPKQRTHRPPTCRQAFRRQAEFSPSRLRQHQQVTYKRNLPAIGRPRRDVHRTLTAEKRSQNACLASGKRHQAHDNILVGRVPGYASVVRQKYQPFAIGGWMGKPVRIGRVFGDLLLVGAIRLHAPDFHVAGALGVKIDILAVGRIFGPIVEALGGR